MMVRRTMSPVTLAASGGPGRSGSRRARCVRPCGPTSLPAVYHWRDATCTTTATVNDPRRPPGHRGAERCGRRPLLTRSVLLPCTSRTTGSRRGTGAVPVASAIRNHAPPLSCRRATNPSALNTPVHRCASVDGSAREMASCKEPAETGKMAREPSKGGGRAGELLCGAETKKPDASRD